MFLVIFVFIVVIRDVPAGGTYEGTFKLKTIPSTSKRHVVLFEFNSKELQDITGRTEVRIEDDEDED